MKTVFQTSELAHIWAKQSQSQGRNPAHNVFFEGPKIYSYGYHFCMGNIVKPGIVLINDHNYSKTTAKHLHAVRYAVNHMECIEVRKPDGSLVDNLKGFIDDIKQNIDKITNIRTRQATKDQAKGNLSNVVTRVERYLEATGLNVKKRLLSGDEKTRTEFILYFEAAKDLQALPALQTKLHKLAKAEARKEEKKKAQLLSDAIIELKAWRAHRGNRFHNFRHIDKLPVYLRTSEDKGEIETSKGARISYKSGKLLYAAMQAGKDVIGYDLEGYTIISLNGVLKVGCHEIDIKEIERFAKKEGWKN